MQVIPSIQFETNLVIHSIISLSRVMGNTNLDCNSIIGKSDLLIDFVQS